MASAKKEVFLLYQMGSSDEWTWYSVVGVFLSEDALMDHARKKSMPSDLRVLDSRGGDVVLQEPLEFVAVRSSEGEVPDVKLAEDLASSTAAS